MQKNLYNYTTEYTHEKPVNPNEACNKTAKLVIKKSVNKTLK